MVVSPAGQFGARSTAPPAWSRPISDGGRAVLDLLLKSGGLTQAQITRSLSLAQPTVTRLLQGFEADGLVRIGERESHGPGQPSARVSLNPDYAYAFGFTVLGDRVSAILMDLTGEVRARRSVAMPVMSRAEVLNVLTAARDDILREVDVDPRRVVGGGVAISGFYVDRDRRINPPHYLSDFALIDLGPVFERALHMAIAYENDGATAAIAEQLLGIGRRSANFAYLHLANGFGGGVIADGRPLAGHLGNAGDFAAIFTPLGMPSPNLDLLRHCVSKHGADYETLDEMLPHLTLDTPGVEDWIEIAIPPMGILCALLTCTLDPEYIVLGGRLPKAIAARLAERIEIVPGTNRRGYPPPRPIVTAAEGPSDPAGVGAAAMMLRRLFFA